MNVTPSKLLLGLSLTAYTWCSWDHLLTGKSSDALMGHGKELATVLSNKQHALALSGDPFHSVPLPGGAPVAGVIAAGATPDALTADGKPPPTNLKLQGTLLVPPQRAAILNGRIVNEGEWDASVSPPVRVQRVGQDFVVVEGATGTLTIKIEEPDNSKSPAASGGSSSSSGGGGSGGVKLPYRPGAAAAVAK